MSGRATTLGGTGFAAGDVILGKYRIERLLGKGGMGMVLAATHLGLDQPVAIKMLLPALAMRVDVVARFSREARAAAKLKSEHVVRVTDVGALDGGAPYMVMEYLSGRDLEALLDERGPLPIGDAVEWVLQACEALAEAHAGGVVHRDLKPSNLFLAKRADGGETIKLLDFGISKATSKCDDQEQSLTGLDTLMGSPRYMSPEQLRSARDVDARADIWSLGVILYQLISGRCPFEAETAPQLIAQLASEPPTPIEKVKSGIPGPLAKAIGRCLEKDPNKRFASIRELAEAIAPFAAKGGATARLQRIDRAASNSKPLLDNEEVPQIERVAMRVAETQASFAEDLGVTLAPPDAASAGNKKFLGVGLVALLFVSIGATAAAFWRVYDLRQEEQRAAEAFVLRAAPPQTSTATISTTVVSNEKVVHKVRLKKQKKRREPKR